MDCCYSAHEIKIKKSLSRVKVTEEASWRIPKTTKIFFDEPFYKLLEILFIYLCWRTEVLLVLHSCLRANRPLQPLFSRTSIWSEHLSSFFPMRPLWNVCGAAHLSRAPSLSIFLVWNAQRVKKSNLNAACSFPQTLNSAVPSAHAPTEPVESMTEIRKCYVQDKK